jgi:hypothetical protein
MSLQELADSVMTMDHRLFSLPKREREWCRNFVVKKLKEAYDMGRGDAKNVETLAKTVSVAEEDSCA